MKMDILYQQLSRGAESGISTLEVELPYFIVPWHYHPETEIIFIEKSRGTRFVGDHSEPFDEGDVGLVGSNLPHVWQNDAHYRKGTDGLYARALVVHFMDDIFQGAMGALPEMSGIRALLEESQRGITFSGTAREEIALNMKGIVRSSGTDKFIRLVRMLDFMATTRERHTLASAGYARIRESDDFDRFDRVHRYMIEHFKDDPGLEDVARIAGMTPSSFCKYFKKRTTKTYLGFLNEIRIGHACKLLLEDRMTIAGVCFESGFNNVSHFNEQFRKVKGMTPGRFRSTRWHDPVA
jgi:AraC-like DNA-binding protein